MVDASSYESKVSAALVQMLADSMTFQALVGADDATSAKAFIVEDDAGDLSLAVDGTEINTAGSFSVIRTGEARRTDRAFMTWGREGEAEITLGIRFETNDTPDSAFRRARNCAGLIAADLQALVGASASRLAYATFQLGDVLLADEVGSLANSFVVSIAVAWRDIP